MKHKLITLILSIATTGLVSFAQDNNSPPAAADEAPVLAQADKPAGQPKPAAQPAANGQPGAPDEVVPLIVIDEVPLTDAIRNLARQSNLNFQFDPRITASNQPTVSIRFENVTAAEALTAVLENYNLQLVRDPRTRIARITVRDPQAAEPLFSRIIQVKYSDPTNLITLVRSTLSPRSSVMADARTAQLIVTTTEKEMDGVIALVEKLDTPTRQVLIEARLLETSKNPTTIKGIDWSGTFAAQQISMGNNRQIFPVQGGRSELPPLATDWPKIIAGPGNPALAFLNADGLSAVLSLLNTDTETEVVATPRAVTLDNQAATLTVTRAFPIFTVTPGSANSPAGAQITYTNLGVILNVTPRIAADNSISLKVVPEVSNIDGRDEQVIFGLETSANIYAIRRIETSVLIPSGNTLVMGGLINDAKTKAWTKVPILGDIPLLGKMFTKSEKSRKKTNLLIFITPTVVGDEAFHVTESGSEFLRTRFAEAPEEPESALDSAKPHDWSKPVH
jgi:type II secretory pathway component GspD/PulD (secretin)